MERTRTVLIGSDALGRGDDAVGRVLMTNFLRELSEQEQKPEAVILWNGGVRLAAGPPGDVERAAAREHLRRLADSGVAVLA